MRCSLCDFLIIKPQTTLHHAVWYGAVQYYLRCNAVMPFCEQFWCNFCVLCGLCGLVNTPANDSTCTHTKSFHLLLIFINLHVFIFSHLTLSSKRYLTISTHLKLVEKLMLKVKMI